jgi:ribosomal protein S18 acetylase RimI-like enzyme
MLRFRFAGIADTAAVVALVESAYRGDQSRAGWTTEADLLDGQRTDREEVGALLADPAVHIVLAEAGELLGSVLVRAEGAGTSHIGMFAVRPTLQGRGIGRQLLAEAERVARDEQHALRIKMTVIEQRHELIGWYERRGYRETGAKEPFPYGDPRFGLPKRDDLRFSVLEKLL